MNNNKKRINNEQELFELFCDPHSESAFKQKPYHETQHKKVFATDGKILILMDTSMLSRTFEESEFSSIRKLTLNSAEGYFTFESLKKTLESFGMEEEQEVIEVGRECEECEGSGYVEWTYIDLENNTYELTHECPICDGEGETKDVFKSTGFMIPTYNSFVRIGKSFFRGVVAQKLLWAMEYFNVDKAAFAEGKNSISITLNNGVEIAIASLEPFESQHIVTLETTKQTN